MKLDAHMIPGTGKVKFLSFEVSSESDTRELAMLTAMTVAHLQGGAKMRITLPDGTSKEWTMSPPQSTQTFPPGQ